MNYAKIESSECINGKGWGTTLWVQGCPIQCPDCQNKHTGDFNAGKEFKDIDFFDLCVNIENPICNRLSISGGEPLAPQNIMTIAEILVKVNKHFPNKEIGLGTGYTREQLQERIRKAFEQGPNGVSSDIYLRMALEKVDMLIAGPFIGEEKDLTLQGRGSRNQEVIDMLEDSEGLYE